MNIQLNTDKNIGGNEKLEAHVKNTVTHELSRFSNYLTRVEVHLADENGSKNGQDDKRCTIEARLEHKQPIAVTSHANSSELALQNGLQKLRASLETIVGKLNNH
jgi:ribosome-associated translation inhibitor RaiA